MLNFSKIKVALIYLFFIFLSIFVLLNFQNKDERLVDRQVNLGLDLQGGSYLLLEIDTDPLIIERLQSKVIPIKKFLSENSIEYNNFQIKKDKIYFNIDEKLSPKFSNLFTLKEKNIVNPYIDKYRSHELSHSIKKIKLKLTFPNTVCYF